MPVLPGKGKGENAGNLTGDDGAGTLSVAGILQNIEPPESMHSRKLEELIVHLGSHSGVTNLGLTKLWKLIYFVDARALRELGEPVTGSEFIKYEHGPVPSRGEKHLRRMTRNGEVTTTPRDVGGKTLNEVKAARTPDLSVFSKVELGVIDAVCAELGRKSATILSDLSHKEPSWHYAPMREKLSPELMAYGCEEDAEGL
jgi:uncharacterized phage-associated protein